MPVEKDNVDLVFNIKELAGLFEKSRSLSDFLQTVVSVVAFHMKSAICSVYLLDEQENDLVLTANQGLNTDLVGRFRLRMGEGIVGSALQDLRTIRTASASAHPKYKHVPNSFEENYESFLAAPILRGLNRIGVLVVQDTQIDYFTANDADALQAIAGQLATTVENAKLLMSLYDRGEGMDVIVEEEEKEPLPNFFKGRVASVGLALGRATIVGETDTYLQLTERMLNYHSTIDEFHESLAQSEQQLRELQDILNVRFSDVASLIFSAHLLILKDLQFSGEMLALIEQGKRPQLAITEVVNRYVSLFARNKNPRLREKVQDIKDVGHRLLHNLLKLEDYAPDYTDEIVICGELLPSDIVKLSTQHVEGLVMVGGGVTSHISILARSMEIPVLLVEDHRIFEVMEGTRVLLDANVGSVFIDPSEDVLTRYTEVIETRERVAHEAIHIEPESYTRDGVRIRLLANINLLNELPLAVQFKAEGVGLYRSEFPFIVRSEFPSEEEQYRIYRTIAESMGDRPVILRTLDIGGDKMLSYYPAVDEANPFLGLRALRFTLRNKHIFVQQLRAMLRGGEGADLGILFPMVASVDEFIEAREIVYECLEELLEQGIPHNPHPKLGPMIELPSAVEVAGELAAESDFLCIGTNDLIQYVLAVDRTNEMIADYYVPHHPAVLRSLKRVVAAGRKLDVPVSLCGDMATDPTMLPFLIGIGIDRFSMDFRSIPKVQKRLAEIDHGEATLLAEQLLKVGTIRELTERLSNGSHG
jgi:phosphotransferase system enzyme I (PtsP)